VAYFVGTGAFLYEKGQSEVFAYLIPFTALGFVRFCAALRYRYDALQDGFSTPLLVNLLFAGFAAYFVSELMLDHNWARIPGHFKREYHFRSVLEETVELLGHFLLAVTVVVATAPREGSEGGSQ
jgi:hypothetical protein